MDYSTLTTEELADIALNLGFMPPENDEDVRQYYIDCLERYNHAVESPMEQEGIDAI